MASKAHVPEGGAGSSRVAAREPMRPTRTLGTGPLAAPTRVSAANRALVRDALAGGGRPLDSARRAPVEKAAGLSLGAVRVHTGPRVRVAARAMGAAAFACGPDIGLAVAPGRQAPEGLLRHELVHVAQQATEGSATPAEAEQQAAAAGRGHELDAVVGTGGPYLACAAEDWLQSTPSLRQYGYSELVDELAEVDEWLERQVASSPETDRIEEARAALQAEIARRRRAMAAPDRPRRRRSRGRRPEAVELPPQTEMPRILGERTSRQLTDPAEIRTEVDRITAWLQRPDLTPGDRAILRAELDGLAPALGSELQQRSAQRQQARLARALTPTTGTDRAGVLTNLRVIESIRPYQEQPGMAYVLHEGELVVFPQSVADSARAQVLSALGDAARRAAGMNDGTEYRMSEHMRLNYEEQPVVGFIVSVVSGEEPVELQSRMLDPLSESQVALSRFRRAQARGSLVEMAEAVFTALENADRAQRIVLDGVDRAIGAAGSVVHGLTVVRDLSFAVSLSIGAIVAAPVVAAGVSGLGATGLTATGLTALGTGGVVGTQGAVMGFTGGFGGELAAGRDVDQALEGGVSEASRVGRQGVAIGVGGGASAGLAGNLGLSAQGLTRGQTLWRSMLAQGGGNALGSATGGLLAPPEGMGRGEAMLRGGLSGFALGSFGGAAGAYAQSFSSPATRYLIATGAPSLLDAGVTYAQTGDVEQAALAGGMGLAIGALGTRQPEGPTSGQVRAFELGRAARGHAGSLARTSRTYLAAAMLGLDRGTPALSVGDTTAPMTLLAPGATPRVAVGSAPTQPPTATDAQVQQPAAHGATAASQTQTQTQTQAQAQAQASFAGLVEPLPATGPVRSVADRAEQAAAHGLGDAMGGTHSSARVVRQRAGVTGAMFESAHLLAQTVGAAINRVRPGAYSPGRALAVLLPPHVHSAFDQGWVPQWNQRVSTGRRTTLEDAHVMLRTALDSVPDSLLSSREKGSLLMMLDSEFARVDLPRDTVLIP